MIQNLSQTSTGLIEIDATMETNEFKQLGGELANLRVFAVKSVSEPASVIQTGAKHQFASYLLFPVSLRRRFKTDQFDFRDVTCGAFQADNRLYIVYEVPRKGVGESESIDQSVSSNTIIPENRLRSEIDKLKQDFSSR